MRFLSMSHMNASFALLQLISQTHQSSCCNTVGDKRDIMRSARHPKPKVIPPAPPSRKNKNTQDDLRDFPGADSLQPEIREFLMKTKQFLEELDNQQLSQALRMSRDDLYRYFTTGTDSLDIYDDPSVYLGKTNMTASIDEGITYVDPAKLYKSDQPDIVVEEETYDLMGLEEEMDEAIKSPEIMGDSSLILSSLADHKSWLWRKENLLKTSRYWALVYSTSLYLYNTAQDKAAVEVLSLKDGSMKKHKRGIKFVLNIPTGKSGKKKQHQLHTESKEKTSQWIKALDRAIALAGRDTGNKEVEQQLDRKQSRASTISGLSSGSIHKAEHINFINHV